MTPLKVLQKLFEVRDQIHFSHLNTHSYSEHKALNEMYETWLDLSDKFIETYQGKHGRIQGLCEVQFATDVNVREYLILVMVFLNQDIKTVLDDMDSDLDNIVADMKQLVNHTLYLLTLK
jgi:hypothetical protein